MTARMEPFSDQGTLDDVFSEPWDRLFPEARNETKPPVRDTTSDAVVTAVCSLCGSVFLPHAFRRHLRQRHGEESLQTRPIFTSSRMEPLPENSQVPDIPKESLSRLVAEPDESVAKLLTKPRRSDPGRTSNDVRRLPAKDMPLFGRNPETDPVITIVCSYCNCVFLPHAFRKHVWKRHGGDPANAASIIVSSPVKSKNSSPSKKTSKLASTSSFESTDDDLISIANRAQIDFTPNVICSICSTSLPPQAFRRHVLKQHGDDSSAKALLPSATVKVPSGKKPSPAKKLAKLISMSPPDLTEEISKDVKKSSKIKKCKSPIPPELELMLPSLKRNLLIPTIGPPELSPVDLPKKSSKKKPDRKPDKIYDPNKNCGVINETGKPCLRSILCKVHLVALKRAVKNRSLPYDALAKLQKTQNDEDRRPKDSPPVHVPAVKEVPPVCVLTVTANEVWTDQSSIKSVEPPAKRIKTEEVEKDQYLLSSEEMIAFLEETLKDHEEIELPRPEPLVRWASNVSQVAPLTYSPPPIFQLEDIPWHASHPRPLATNTFGCRLVGGLLTKSKKLDAVRKHMQSFLSTQGGCNNDNTNKLPGFSVKHSSSTKSSIATPSSVRRKKTGTNPEMLSNLLQRTSQNTTNGGVPLRLFQGNLPVQQPPAFLQFNLCPSK